MINPTLISREIELDLAKLQLLSKVAADDNDFPVHIDTNLRRQKTTLDIIEYTSKLDCALIHAARSACEVARWASTLASITGLRHNATQPDQVYMFAMASSIAMLQFTADMIRA